jgi:hypothetical protein
MNLSLTTVGFIYWDEEPVHVIDRSGSDVLSSTRWINLDDYNPRQNPVRLMFLSAFVFSERRVNNGMTEKYVKIARFSNSSLIQSVIEPNKFGFS